jgi:hypothetical protein
MSLLPGTMQMLVKPWKVMQAQTRAPKWKKSHTLTHSASLLDGLTLLNNSQAGSSNRICERGLVHVRLKGLFLSAFMSLSLPTNPPSTVTVTPNKAIGVAFAYGRTG